METSFTRSEFLSQILAPADIHPRMKYQSDGSHSAEGDQNQASPWASSVTMTLRKTLQGSVRAWPEWCPGILMEKLSPGAPPQTPDPGLLTPGMLGSLSQVGFGLLGRADWEEQFPRCLSPELLSCSPASVQPQEPHLGRGGAWSFI